ncbi:MAG: cytochrome-c peroxidase [Pseudomonadota bacterium]
MVSASVFFPYLPHIARLCLVTGGLVAIMAPAAAAPPLGLPPVAAPMDNPTTPEKAALGEALFNDARFSATGKVSCATCHDPSKAFTDSPLRVSKGINDLTGTRNAPTVVNAAYMKRQFWDGREASLESQSKQPFLNPVEMALPSHAPILAIVRGDPAYADLFRAAFGVSGEGITIDHVAQAIASFERTVVSGDSPFDRYYFAGDKTAMSAAAVRGLEVFVNQGRCVSCHTISQSFALFTDSKFHNLNVSFDKIATGVKELAAAQLAQKAQGADVDVKVLTEVAASELGRYMVSERFQDIGAFKTPTLRNVARTAPYMHDGSLETLEAVVDFYNNGGRVKPDDPINDFQSGGIRPLELDDMQKADLVAFLEALTSPQFAAARKEGSQP